MNTDNLPDAFDTFEQRGPNLFEKILRFSIQHRLLLLLLTVGVAVLGAFSLRNLPIDAVPDITNNQVQINTEVSALSPVEIEKQVTFIIETALAGIPGLEYTRSISRNAFSQVTAVFSDDTDIYFARQQVIERLSAANESLPPGAEPQMGPISTGLGEIYMYVVEYTHPDGQGATVLDEESGWQSDGSYLTPEGERLVTDVEKEAYLRTVQDWLIAPQLRTVEGVAGVDSIGGWKKQYHVQPDPMNLVSYGLTFHDVLEALEKNNVSTGAGFIERKGESYVVRTDSRVGSLEEIRSVVVGESMGTPIFIRDVAEVLIGKELRTGAGSQAGAEAVIGTALMLIGANSRTVSIAVDEKMVEIRRNLPPGIDANTVLNRTSLVDATIQTVRNNLAEGAILVIVILFLMLGNIRAAIITALAIPLSMLMAAIGMVQAGISGNLMSLGAIDFGIIIDGSVIIVENCLRVLAERQISLKRPLTLGERLHAVLHATKEMVQPSVFGQAIIVTVYFPILSLSGVEGKMFHPMAWTVIFALAGAFILSLTFVPAAVAVFVTGKVTEKEGTIVRMAKKLYAPILETVLKFRAITVSGGVAAFAMATVLFMSMGQEFIPTLNEGNIAMHAMRIPSTSLTQSKKMQRQVELAIRDMPEVAFVYSKTGTAEMASDPMPPSVSDTFIILKDRSEWPDPTLSIENVRQGVEDRVMKLPGNNYEFLQPIQMRFNELIAGVRSDLAIKIYGDDFDIMLPVANEIARVLQSIPGGEDVKVEQIEGLPVMTIDIDRQAAARYGLSMLDVQDVIAIAIGGREAGLVFEGDRRFDLVVRLPEEVRQNIVALESLPIPLPVHDEMKEVSLASLNRAAPYIPLGSIATIRVEEGLNQISRENGKRRIVVQANVRGRDLGGYVEQAREFIDSQVKIPPGSWLAYGGTFENLERARQRLTIVLPVCFFLIFLLLFSTFNSVRYALLVFTGVPLALTGGVVSLWLRDIDFSISAAVGFIALSGVAVLNGLVMVSYINQLREEGLPLHEAIRKGAMTRLRPVLMTALVASLGFLPMALSESAGAEVQRPLATVVIGGLITSTLLTLLVLPALYSWFAPKREEVEI
jgi:cobalt-zinc-cadmium resistance protein CzcA